jgi:competence protein ComFC
LTFKKPFLYWLESSFWNVIDLVFPPVCPGCQEIGERWCEECQNAVIRMPAQVCEICGEPSVTTLCKRCNTSRPSLTHIRSWAVFKQPVRNALHTLKYRNNIALGHSLAKSIAPGLCEFNWPVQVILPIPLSEQRYRERGYNQAALVARPLAQLTGLDYQPGALRRARHTRSQVGLSVEERKQNLKKAFQPDEKLVAGKDILLVDDVCTTGATLIEAAVTLAEAGARSVYAYTVARAISHHDA